MWGLIVTGLICVGAPLCLVALLAYCATRSIKKYDQTYLYKEKPKSCKYYEELLKKRRRY